MRDRGYPTEDHDQVLADLSVEHGQTLDHYRQARQISLQAEGGTASTEDLRLAMLHYRTLFGDLLGQPAEAGTAPAASPPGSGSAPEAGTAPEAPARNEPAAPVVGGSGAAPAPEPGTDSGLPADARPSVPTPRDGPAR
jgi:hypothetical protein